MEFKRVTKYEAFKPLIDEDPDWYREAAQKRGIIWHDHETGAPKQSIAGALEEDPNWHRGDWVVREEGVLQCYSEEEFRKTYTEIDPFDDSDEERLRMVSEIHRIDAEAKALEAIQENPSIWDKYNANEQALIVTQTNILYSLIGILMIRVNTWRDVETAGDTGEKQNG